MPLFMITRISISYLYLNRSYSHLPLLAKLPSGVTLRIFRGVEQASVVRRQRKVFLDSKDQVRVRGEVPPEHNRNLPVFVLLVHGHIRCFWLESASKKDGASTSPDVEKEINTTQSASFWICLELAGFEDVNVSQIKLFELFGEVGKLRLRVLHSHALVFGERAYLDASTLWAHGFYDYLGYLQAESGFFSTLPRQASVL